MPKEKHKYLDALLERNEELIAEIYLKYAPECKYFILKNNGTVSDAKDIFQETLIALLMKLETKKIELTVPFGAYLYSIYKNKWIDQLRKKRKNHLTIIDNDRYVVEEYSGIMEKQYAIYKECFELLGEECKQLMRARFAGMRGNDIAAKLGITRNYVNQKMLVCRKKLKKCCQNHPDFRTL